MIIQLPLFEYELPITIPNKAKQFLFETDCKIIVAFSGGKDSVAMVLYLLDLGIDKSRIELHHHLVDGKNQNLFVLNWWGLLHGLGYGSYLQFGYLSCLLFWWDWLLKSGIT